MDTLAKQWCVWLIGRKNHLLSIEFVGGLEECVRFVEPRCYGYYAIMPYDAPAETLAGVK